MQESEYRGLRRGQLSVLLFAVFLDIFGFGIIIPLLPFLSTEFGASPFVYGMIVGVYSLFQFIFAPIWGRLSDRVGRRPIILIGLLGAGFAFVIFGLATNLTMIFVSRILAGIFTSASLTTANAYIADQTPPEKRGRYFGYIGSALGLGFALGPAIGGFLAEQSLFGLSGHSLPSFIAGGFSLINFVIALILLPESLNAEFRSNRKLKSQVISKRESRFRKVRNIPGALLLISIFSLVAFGFSMLIASYSLWIPEIDDSVGESDLGWYFSFAGAAFGLSQAFFIGPLIDRYGEETVVKIGTFLMFIGFATLPFIPYLMEVDQVANLPHMSKFVLTFIPSLPLFFGFGFINPSVNSLLSKKISRQQQGEILGIKEGYGSLMRVFGPLLAGGLMEINFVYPFYLGAIIFFIAWNISQLRLRIQPEPEKGHILDTKTNQ